MTLRADQSPGQVVPGTSPPEGQAALSGSAPRDVDFNSEEEFHDEWGKTIDPEQVPVIESFEAWTAPENRFILDWLGDVRGLRLLDLGSGAGEAAVYFALKGARVTAVDLSAGMLKVTQRVADRYEVRVDCLQQNAESLSFPDGTFDVVYCANLLHHVNLAQCLVEITRVLKRDGRCVTWDPLRHNPVINIYRRMAAKVRTEDERPMSITDLEVFRRYFQTVDHRCYWLAGLWIFMRFFLIDRVHPSKERYWKKIILEAGSLQGYRKLAYVDERLTTHFPWLRRMCWNLVVCSAIPRSP